MRENIPRSWTDDLLDRIDTGIDVSQVAERLQLSPTERLERMIQVLAFLEECRRDRADELSHPA